MSTLFSQMDISFEDALKKLLFCDLATTDIHFLSLIAAFALTGLLLSPPQGGVEKPHMD